MTKKTKEVDAVELKAVDPIRVSLVDHAATGLPFRITKSAGKILDLEAAAKSLLKPVESVEPESTVQAVFIGKSASDETRKMLADEYGPVTTEKSDAGEKIIISPTDEKSVLYQMTDNVLIALKGFSEFPMSESFAQNAGQTSVYPSLRVAGDAFTESVMAVLHSGSDKKAVQEKLDKIISEFSAYTKGIVSNIPASVFKMEGMIAAEKPPEPDPVEQQDAPGEVEKAAEPEPESEPEADSTPPVDPSFKENMETLRALGNNLKSVMTQARANLDASIEKSDKATTQLAEQVAAQGAEFKKELASVKSMIPTVAGMTAPIDQAPSSTVQPGSTSIDKIFKNFHP